MRQPGPSGIKNPVPPLGEDFQPGIQMKLNVVTGRRAEKKEGNLDCEGRRGDGQKRRPQQGSLGGALRRT